uniref:Uncharacterized protein n=1 Tax=Trypanosoma vivax (strain Y486) TaxID=1055687 RepID=G0U615_TRYVY|nr:hypothetical protein, conserved in T. vivax [Trypanosoma vivax Y486]
MEPLTSTRLARTRTAVARTVTERPPRPAFTPCQPLHDGCRWRSHHMQRSRSNMRYSSNPTRWRTGKRAKLLELVRSNGWVTSQVPRDTRTHTHTLTHTEQQHISPTLPRIIYTCKRINQILFYCPISTRVRASNIPST